MVTKMVKAMLFNSDDVYISQCIPSAPPHPHSNVAAINVMKAVPQGMLRNHGEINFQPYCLADLLTAHSLILIS